MRHVKQGAQESRNVGLEMRLLNKWFSHTARLPPVPCHHHHEIVPRHATATFLCFLRPPTSRQSTRVPIVMRIPRSLAAGGIFLAARHVIRIARSLVAYSWRAASNTRQGCEEYAGELLLGLDTVARGSAFDFALTCTRTKIQIFPCPKRTSGYTNLSFDLRPLRCPAPSFNL